ncbi:hypothetical protein NA56DRAFT_652830 [Hyaloscypha hepaticicola]|uniref:Uncharacterized protein n=1 Tax=Hyaloscypha hepaticicola TaxID=2082293 RepID=A0A2J6PD41_9HELO|nr:hypothetical protein NA56DRAFT_652830 [Hyaloscypha hepaticicola]
MASSSSPAAGNMSTVDKPLTSAEKKGLQLPRSKTVAGKKQIVAPTRHGPLTINQGEKGGRRNGNFVNQNGSYRQCTYMPCITAIGHAKESFILGTGSSTANIYFSCLVHDSYGKNGSVCGRCLTLGSTEDKCRDPPRELLPDIRHLMKEAPRYNELLKAHPNTPVRDWVDAEKKEFMAIVNKAKLLILAFEGLLKKHPGLQSTPRKRKFEDDFTTGKDLSAISQQTADTRSDLKMLHMALTDITKKQTRLLQNQERILKRQKISRERECYLVNAIKTLTAGLDSFEGINVTLADFDLANTYCISDNEPDEDEIEENIDEEDT